MAWEGPKWGREVFFFRLIQTLPTFFGRTDLDFENFYLKKCIPNSQISRSPEIWPGLGLPGLAPPDILPDPASHLSKCNKGSNTWRGTLAATGDLRLYFLYASNTCEQHLLREFVFFVFQIPRLCGWMFKKGVSRFV